MYPLRRPSFIRLVVLAGAMMVMAAVSVACGGSGSPTASPTADRVVAVVNGHPVRESDVAVVRAEKRLLGQSDAMPAALKEAIDRELVRREAARLGVAADVAVVRRRMAGVTTQAGGAAALTTSLRHAAMTADQLHQSITDGALREAVQNATFTAVVADGRAAQAYYVQHRRGTFTRAAAVHLRAIPVRTEMVAKNALGRIRQGRPFAEVARQFSIDPESRDAGGDLGLLLTSSLPGPLRRAAASAKLGVLAKPVRVGGGWYVVDVVARRPQQVIPYATVRAAILKELTQEKRAKALKAWLATARKDAVVERP